MKIFDPLDKFFKSVTGAVRAGSETVFRVRGAFSNAALLLERDNEAAAVYPMRRAGDDIFELTLTLGEGLYFYCFDIGNGLFISRGKGLAAVISDNPVKFQLTVYAAEYTVPEWIKGGIIYQIFPDRFSRSENDKALPAGKVFHKDTADDPFFLPDSAGRVLNNDFFGGDFKGIALKLDYLATLGVTAIYLNPVFSAYSNHRYDTADYMSFDPVLGSEKDFRDLIKSAEERGIKIILDGVFNHTGDDSVYFDKYGHYGGNGAYSDKNSRYINWYEFIDYPTVYRSWWGISTLPSTNKSDSGFTEFIAGENGVLEHYTKMGIGGWRLDVADELPSSFVKDIRRAVKSADPAAVIIGEVWEDATNKISYGTRREYFLGKELDSVMNYPLKNAVIDFVKYGSAENLGDLIKEQIDHYPACSLDCMMNILGTHDTVRLLSAVGDYAPAGKSKGELSKVFYTGEERFKAVNRLKAAALIQYTLKGVPCVYYGDEAGMQGFSDPLNRRFFPWKDIDGEIFDWYKKLGEIRRRYGVFAFGDCKVLYAKNGMIVYKRFNEESEVLIAVNVSEKEVKLEFKGRLKELLTGEIFHDFVSMGKFCMGIYVAE